MRSGGTASFIRDNLEAFAVAIAMALVIRHYCIEAFRIPTRSMVPTLLGDAPPDHGDRILVDKFAYLRRDPRRWEVVVFQYPLNRNRNFIKRLVGLPDEWLRIVDGDIWTSRDEGESWTIERKPPGVREQMLFPYYPMPPEEPKAFAGRDNWERETGWEISERARRFQVKTDKKAALTFRPSVTPFPEVDSDGYGSLPHAGDVRVRFDLEVKRAGTLVVRITEHGRHHRLVLGKDESYVLLARTPKKEHRYPVDVKLEDGMELSVSFTNVDDTLIIGIDGDEDFEREIEFPNPPAEPDGPYDEVRGKHQIAFEAEGIEATLLDVGIDRDLYYDANTPDPMKVWKIPADHFFMLGDNTRHSKDGRVWKVVRANLKDGSAVTWEAARDTDVPGQPYAQRAEGGEDAVIRVAADIDGHVRFIRNGDVVDFETGIPWSFVSRDHLVGRAFAIFWPIHFPPVYRGGSRVNLIH